MRERTLRSIAAHVAAALARASLGLMNVAERLAAYGRRGSPPSIRKLCDELAAEYRSERTEAERWN